MKIHKPSFQTSTGVSMKISPRRGGKVYLRMIELENLIKQYQAALQDAKGYAESANICMEVLRPFDDIPKLKCIK